MLHGFSERDRVNDRIDAEKLAYAYARGFSGVAEVCNLATLRFPYIVDMESGKLTWVNEETLTSLLADYEDLLSEFRAEDNKKCDVIIKYLNLLNERQESEN